MSLSSSPSAAGQLRSAPPSSTPKPRLILRASAPKPDGTARKFTSDFFGRNKSETSAIPDGVWAFVSRKDYQRSKYASEKSAGAYQTFWLSALRTQLIRLRLWRPEANYEVKLLARAGERLSAYNAELVRNGDDIAAAQSTVFVEQIIGKKGPIPISNADAIDPIQAQHIQTNFAGIRSIDYILDTILPWIRRSLRSGALARMPPIEFLVQASTTGDTINEPSKNYEMWRDYEEPRWTKSDHQAAIALMSLNSQPNPPMITTWEAYNAAIVAGAAKCAASTSVSPAHNTNTESTSSTIIADPEPQQKTLTSVYKGRGKRRMVEEDEEKKAADLFYNGRSTASKRLKLTVAPPSAPASGKKPRQYTSMTMVPGRQVCEVRGQDD